MNVVSNLIPLGIGIVIGVCVLWIAVQLSPLFITIGAMYLLYKTMSNPDTESKE